MGVGCLVVFFARNNVDKVIGDETGDISTGRTFESHCHHFLLYAYFNLAEAVRVARLKYVSIAGSS